MIKEFGMVVSYKKLLIDKDMMKKELQSKAGISWVGYIDQDVKGRVRQYGSADEGLQGAPM